MRLETLKQKTDLCWCEECLIGNLSLYSIEEAIFISNGQVLSDVNDDEEVNDYDNDHFNDSVLQENEIPIETLLIL